MKKKNNLGDRFSRTRIYFILFMLVDFIVTLLIYFRVLCGYLLGLRLLVLGLFIYLYHRKFVFPGLIRKMREQKKQMEYINTLERISRIFVTNLNFSQVCLELKDELKKIIKFTDCQVYSLNEEKNNYITYSMQCAKQESSGEPKWYPLKNPRVKEVIEKGRYRIYSDQKKNIILIPLLCQNGVIGVLELERPLYRKFTNKDYQILYPIAERLAISLQNFLLYQKAKELSLKDYLTGMANRRALEQQLEIEYKRVKENNSLFSLLIIDIDHFKSINDTYGHLAGDDVLREVANLMKNEIRSKDLVGRFGGEEFVILLPDTDQREAFLVADRLRQRIADHIFYSGSLKIKLTVSIGVATCTRETDSISNLLKGADFKLYKAKDCGRNKVIQIIQN